MAMVSVGRDGSSAGGVDEEDFIQAFEDVPTVQVWSLVYSTFLWHFQPPYSTRRITDMTSFSCPALHQIYSNREVEEAMTKIRDVLSDDKRDWELRVAAVRHPDLSVMRIG